MADARRKYLGLALLLSVVILLIVHMPRLLDSYVVEEDFRNLYWLHRFQDMSLFEADPLVQQQVIEVALGDYEFVYSKYSPGYGFLFQLGTVFFSAPLFSKLLAFPLMLISVYYMFRIAEAMGSLKQAFAVSMAFVLLNLMLSTDISVDGGLQRSFTMPLLLAMGHYLIQKSDVKAAVVVFLGVIYPPMFVINALAYGLSLLGRDENGRITIAWRRVWPLVIASILALLMMLPAFVLQVGSEDVINQTSSDEVHILQDAVFGRDGRYPLFQTLFFGDGGLYNFNLTGLATTIMLLLSVFFWLVLRGERKKLPASLWIMFYAGVLGFCISWMGILLTSSLALYIPNRFVRTILFLNSFLFVAYNLWTATFILWQTIRLMMQRTKYLLLVLFLFIVLFVGYLSARENIFVAGVFQLLLIGLFLLCLALVVIESWKLPNREPAGDVRQRPFIVVGLFIALGLVLGAFTLKAQASEFYVPTAEERTLYKFLQALPADSLIAGHPCSLDSVQMYAARKVLYSCEIPNPDTELMLTALDAYYSEDIADVARFCDSFEVSHLVVDTAVFAPEEYNPEEVYFEPFSSQLAPRLAGREHFALQAVPDDTKLFNEGTLFVVSCEDIGT